MTNKVSVQIRVTVPLDTLRGVGNEPGKLAGYGPIPAKQARELAADPDSVWQRLVTGPFSGALLDYGTTRYRPPPHLAEHVIARHQCCQHPGCRVPAHLCDLDHNQPLRPTSRPGADVRGEPRAEVPTASPVEGLSGVERHPVRRRIDHLDHPEWAHLPGRPTTTHRTPHHHSHRRRATTLLSTDYA